MRKLHSIICFAAIWFISLSAGAQDDKDQATKAWMDYSTPGEGQKLIEKLVGDWKADISEYRDRTQPQVQSTAMVHNEMIMGGRYLSIHYTGTMRGMPFDGMGTMAFNNGTYKYCSTWIDNLGTGIIYMEGSRNVEGSALQFKGMGYDPIQKKEVSMRQVIHFNSANDQTIEFLVDINGVDFQVMDIHLTR
ncbi:MAG TPA: DUF1579 family protein [Chitinophagales bacterium]|nr:DUF1579 family protein [Chitinophagales bacterium]